jgi:hypothetical protein
MRVATVDDDIAFVAVWEELLNEVVNSRACHDQQHDLSGGLELLAELLDGVSSDNGLACGRFSMSLEIFRVWLGYPWPRSRGSGRPC